MVSPSHIPFSMRLTKKIGQEMLWKCWHLTELGLIFILEKFADFILFYFIFLAIKKNCNIIVSRKKKEKKIFIRDPDWRMTKQMDRGKAKKIEGTRKERWAEYWTTLNSPEILSSVSIERMVGNQTANRSNLLLSVLTQVSRSWPWAIFLITQIKSYVSKKKKKKINQELYLFLLFFFCIYIYRISFLF